VRRGAFGDGVRLAAGTFTVLRVPPPRLVDPAAAAIAMTLAPVAGAVLALPAGVLATLATAAGAGEFVAAGLALCLLVWVTGGLHLDGLADTVDGLAAGRGDAGRALEVMRRGDVGPLGATALVLVLLLQAAALARALPAYGPWALPLAAAGGRCVLPVLCARGVPAARSGGLGSAVAGVVPRALAVLVPVAVAGAALLATLLVTTAGYAGPAWRAPAAVLAGCVAGVLFAGRAASRVGGITGDVLGAGVETGTTAALVVLALH
jgi:adenosylcobinamide-GDP ribazoletransferase